MPTNPYTAKLQRELADVKTKRWQLKRVLERAANGQHFGDDLDNRRRIERVVREFQWVEREFERLHHELHLPLPHRGAIDLKPYKATAAAPARHPGSVSLKPVRRNLQDELRARGFTSRGYLTKDMIPGR